MAEPLCDLSGGELRTAPLAAILVEALRRRVTGELRLDANGGTSRIYLRGGQPCGAQVFFGFKPLGQFLLELGWIDIEALEQSLAAVVNGRKQGEALVELGFLTREKLHLGLALHHQRHIRVLSALGEGTYSFQPLPDLPQWTDELRLSAHRAIADALAAEPGHKVAQRILQRVPPGLGLRLRSGWERFTGHFQLDAAEQVFVAGLERATAIDIAIHAGHVPPERARALVAALKLMAILVPAPLGGEPPWATPGPAVASTPGPVDTPASPIAVPVSSARAAEGTAREQDFGAALGNGKVVWEQIETGETIILDEPAEPFERTVPARPPPFAKQDTAPVGPLVESVPVQARNVPFPPQDTVPVRMLTFSAEDAEPAQEVRPPPPPQRVEDPERAAEAAARRTRMLQRAFENIPGSAIRRDDNAASGEITWETLPPPGDPALEQFLRERAAIIAGQNHYERLCVPRTATRDAIKQAFFAAAKRIHPDRIPSALAPLAPQLKEIFAALNEAYQVLQDDERRRAYLGELTHAASASSERASKVAAVKACEARAGAAALRRDYAAVQRILGEALAIEDRADLRAHILWARQSEKPHEAGEVHRELEQLADRAPRCAAAHYYLGVLARVSGETARAEAAFHRALEAEPEHREARHELKLIEMRKANNHSNQRKR